MDYFIDNSRTEAEKDRDWRDMMRALRHEFHGKRRQEFPKGYPRLQATSDEHKDTDICATVGDLMKTSTIYIDCYEPRCGATEPFEREYLEKYKDAVWGPDMDLWQPCPRENCESSNTGVKVSYSGLPHGEVSGRLIGVKI